MNLIDSHCHLDDEKFDMDRNETIEAVIKSGVTAFISAGYSVEGSRKALELSQKYDFIYATCGISPNDIPQTEQQLWKMVQEIEDMVKTQQKNKIVAIGEIGLDYYWEKETDKRELQKKAFIMQIELANKLGLPIVIHTRDAVSDTLSILKENPVDKKGVFHCCPQNRELIKEALQLGFYISFAGPITFKNAKNSAEMIELVPNDKLLIETDSPYLAPEPVRGTRNTPANVRYVAQRIADVKGITIQEVEDFITKNIAKIYPQMTSVLKIV